MKLFIGQIIFALLFLSFVGHSQILRIDHKEIFADTVTGWQGDLDLDFLINNLKSTQDSTTHYLGFELTTNTSYFSNLHQYYLKSDFRYFTAASENFFDKGFLYFRTNLFRKNKIHPEMVFQAQFDNIRYLDFRVLGMAGFKFRVFAKEKLELDYGLGLMYEHEEWLDFSNNNMLIVKQMPKSSMYLGLYTALGEKFFMSAIQYYQLGRDFEEEIYRHRLSTGIEFTTLLTSKVSWIVKFNMDYDSDPVVPISNMLYQLTNGIKFNFTTTN